MFFGVYLLIRKRAILRKTVACWLRTYPNNPIYCGLLQSPMPALSVKKCSQRGLSHASEPF